MALDWTVETLRVSLFSNTVVKLAQSDWQQITSGQPLEAEQKVAGRHSMSGPFLKGRLNISATAGRVDCVLRPSDAVTDDRLQTVGPWSEISEQFAKSTEQWIAGVGFPVIRLAVGAVLLAAQPDANTAYRSLLGVLKSVQSDPDRVRDLLFRVNWPVSSHTFEGLRINRLTTWSVIQFQVQVLSKTGPNVVMEDNPPSYFVRLEMDHNTDGQHSEQFERSRLGALYRELTTLAVENTEKGELS